MTSYTLALVSLAQIQTLQDIAIETFRATYTGTSDDNDMELYITDAFSLPQLQASLTHTDTAYYFLYKGAHIVGYCKIVWGEKPPQLPEENWARLERIYIRQPYWRQGVGTVMLQMITERIQQRQVKNLWLGVWEKNQRAIQFYEKNGFQNAGIIYFPFGNSIDTDFLMWKSI